MATATPTVHPPRVSSAGLRDAARARPLLAFFVLAFGISGTYELVAFGLLELELLPWGIPAIFGPAVAAIVATRAADGRPGLHDLWRRLTLWRVGVRWYLFALVLLPALAVASFVLLPDGTENLDESAVVVVLTYVATFVVIFLVGGGQEEIGWRGFALPRMQDRFGPHSASVLLGVAWGLWHLPLFVFVDDYDNSGTGFVSIATTFVVFTACWTVGLSIVLTWLYNHTAGSILLAIVLHAAVNATWALAPETRGATMSISLSIAAVALVLVLLTRGRLGLQARPSAEPQEEALPGRST